MSEPVIRASLDSRSVQKVERGDVKRVMKVEEEEIKMPRAL